MYVTFNNLLFIACHNSGSEITGTRTWLNIPGLESWQEQKIFLLSQHLKTGSGAHSTSWSMGTGVLSCSVKQQGYEVDHLPSLRANIKQEWSYISVTPVGFHGIDRSNFILTCMTDYIESELNVRCFYHEKLFWDIFCMSVVILQPSKQM